MRCFLPVVLLCAACGALPFAANSDEPGGWLCRPGEDVSAPLTGAKLPDSPDLKFHRGEGADYLTCTATVTYQETVIIHDKVYKLPSGKTIRFLYGELSPPGDLPFKAEMKRMLALNGNSELGFWALDSEHSPIYCVQLPGDAGPGELRDAIMEIARAIHRFDHDIISVAKCTQREVIRIEDPDEGIKIR